MSLIETPEIEKCLIVSTGHISKLDSEKLTDMASGGFQPLIVMDKDQYGWWICVPGKDDEDVFERASCMSEAFVTLLKEATFHECKWLVLDWCGPQYPNLPIFEW